MGSGLFAVSLLLFQGCGYSAHEDDIASSGEWISADAGIDDEEDPSPTAPSLPSAHAPAPMLSHPNEAVAAAIEAWRARYETHGDLPSPDTTECVARFADLEIVAPSHDDFRRLCRRCDTTDPSPHCEALGRINACAPWGDERDDDGHIGALHAMIVLDRQHAEVPRSRDALIVHETIHHLGTCTGYGPDAAHADTFLWCSSPGCIEGEAFRQVH